MCTRACRICACSCTHSLNSRPQKTSIRRSPASVPCCAGRTRCGPRLGLRSRREAKQKRASAPARAYAGVGPFTMAGRSDGQSDGLALASAYIYRGMHMCTTSLCEAGARFGYRRVLTQRYCHLYTLVGTLLLRSRQRLPGSDALPCVSLNESCPGQSARPSTGGATKVCGCGLQGFGGFLLASPSLLHPR